MKYTKSYDTEDSLVVLFDEKGAYIGHYTFGSEQFYEDYAAGSIMEEGNGRANSITIPKINLILQVCALSIGVTTQNHMTV